MNKWLRINRTAVFGLPCNKYRHDVAMQVRSGDVFKGKWLEDGKYFKRDFNLPNFGQPPLSYYLKCLRKMPPEGSAIAMCEDFYNPVCDTLKIIADTLYKNSSTRFKVVSLSEPPWYMPKTPRVSEGLQATIAYLGCSPTVCAAHSSMRNVYVNSVHTELAVSPKKYPTPWLNTAYSRMEMVIT